MKKIAKYSQWLIDNDKLPSEADVRMTYLTLLRQGWVPFSEMGLNKRNNYDPIKLFPGAQPIKSEDGQFAEPLICVVEGLSFGVFDETGFGYYDYDAVTAPNGLDENNLDGKVVFFPYENVNAYR